MGEQLIRADNQVYKEKGRLLCGQQLFNRV